LFVATSGPLPATVGHFWLTVWQNASKAVLMLNRVLEKGQNKCHQYWPIGTGEIMTFDDVGLKLENVHSVPGDHYTVRKFRLTDIGSNVSRDIEHFHYTTWPDFGVPQCPDTFLEFLTVVRASGSLDKDVGPPVVHCSAGIGRSGTFVLVDSCLVMV
jgi:tyrosine-protein phosphatase non-receptor type 1